MADEELYIGLNSIFRDPRELKLAKLVLDAFKERTEKGQLDISANTIETMLQLTLMDLGMGPADIIQTCHTLAAHDYLTISPQHYRLAKKDERSSR